MSHTDPIADMLTRIRNAAKAGHPFVNIPDSKFKKEILSVLKTKGYIGGFSDVKSDKGDFNEIKVELKYKMNKAAIRGVCKVSKPGKRVYAGKNDLTMGKKLGYLILSTPKGVLSNVDARKEGVGGEIICEVW